jgi:hypothetical protein
MVVRHRGDGDVLSFFAGIDVYTNGRITWSVWPIAAILFFGVGFTLLDRFGRE